MSTRKRVRRALIATSGALALGVGLFAGLGPAPGGASSHREAPLISGDPRVDNTDVYAFVSPDNTNTVTLISAWIPFEEPAGGPNFYAFDANARYQIKVDHDGDGVEEIAFRWEFEDNYRTTGTFLYNTGQVTSLTDTDLNFYQTYDLTQIGPGNRVRTLVDDAVAVPSNVGAASMPDYASLMAEGVVSVDGGAKAFAGQSDDPFFLDLRVFDLLYGLDLSEVGDDTLAGFNVNVLALQVPKRLLALNRNPGANPIIGVWSTASRPEFRTEEPDGSQSFSGDFIQVSRLGMPLVNEVVIPLADKDFWNRSEPVDDLANFATYIQEPEVPELIQAIYGIPAPDLCGDPGAPPRCRSDLVEVFATGVAGLNQPPGVVPSEMIRLNMSIAPCEEGSCGAYSALGVIGGDLAGYPNGRRLADDTIDISLQVVEGELVGNPNDLGDAVDENDVAFTDAFPYLGLPHSGSDADPH
jgi:Domain of unknown function (DUF4331)